MRFIQAWIAFVLLVQAPAFGFALAAGSPQRRCPMSDSAITCVMYLDAYDGDTITVEIPNLITVFGGRIGVRVRGVDTPEMTGHSPCERERAREAKALVHSTLSRAKSVILLNPGRDKYFRILADVVADGVSVGDLLIKSKLAYPYDGGTKSKPNWCAK